MSSFLNNNPHVPIASEIPSPSEPITWQPVAKPSRATIPNASLYTLGTTKHLCLLSSSTRALPFNCPLKIT